MYSQKLIYNKMKLLNKTLIPLSDVRSKFFNPLYISAINHSLSSQDPGSKDKKHEAIKKSVTEGVKSDITVKILVVDDNEDFNEALCNRLTKIGVKVDSCIFGEDAVKKVYESFYDLILLDIVLKDKDLSGIDIFQKMKKIKPHINIILMSAYSKEEKVQRARELPSLTFLEKPFEFNRLKDIIDIIKKGKKK
ncbi:MAG: response regulator [Thermodesulfovibrionales bacterium]